MIAPAWLRLVAILHFIRVVCVCCASDDDGTAPVAAELPQTSADFLASYSCRDAGELMLLETGQDDAFFRWVMAARHTTWHPGWEVDVPPPDANDAAGENGRYYARVFDLLDWARKQDMLPIVVDVASICHKGMEAQYTDGPRWTDVNPVPPQPNAFVPQEMWIDLWDACNKQLLATTRRSSSCIDIPGMLVASPNAPAKANNPCDLEYRMVDGAHRLCLRKYLVALLTGEMMELEALANKPDNIHEQIKQTQALIRQASKGPFIVLDQGTFQSMLVTSDPHTTWAKSKEQMMGDFPTNVRRDWNEWMTRVMHHALENRSDSDDVTCPNAGVEDS